ncbi:MAG: hypothetical protein ABR575_09480 [Actinomycetota bacterium]
MNLQLGALIVAALALHPACDERARPVKNSAAVSTASPGGTQQVRVTRDAQDGPPSCSPQEVGELVVGFFGAINEGSVEVSSFFAPDMQWYSVTERRPGGDKRHFVTYGYDAEKLGAYFDRRIGQHEQLRLLEIDVAYEGARDLAHVAYTLERRADDLPQGHPIAAGKGAIDCGTGTIAVWSMAHEARFQRPGSICPGDAGDFQIAIACTRGGPD